MKHSRRFIAAILTVALVAAPLSLYGCNNTQQKVELTLGDAKVTSPAVQTDGVLRVGVDSRILINADQGTTADNVPFAVFDTKTGQMLGIDLDVAAVLAEKLGLKLEITDIDGQDATTLLQQGSVDLIIGVKPSSEDAPQTGLVGPYMVDGPAIFLVNHSDGAVSFDTAALNGQKIAAQSGSKAAWQAGELYGDQQIVQASDLSQAFEQVDSGTVTYAAADAVVGAYLAIEDYDSISCAGFIGESEGIYLAVAADNTELANQVTEALRGVRDDGTLKLIIAKWLGPASAAVVTSDAAIMSVAPGNAQTTSAATDAATGEATEAVAEDVPTE